MVSPLSGSCAGWQKSYTPVSGLSKKLPRGYNRRMVRATPEFPETEGQAFPIRHWSHSSLMSFLRNPLAWYKRYVEGVYDMPSSPAGIVGRTGHVALQYFYGGIGKDGAIELGLEYLRDVPDFEINFGKAKSRLAKKKKRHAMERENRKSTRLNSSHMSISYAVFCLKK